MWHEARRQEKKIRGIMVDYKRRADRRREFYEKIKQDPAQFLRMYGRPVKIHLDQAVALAAEGPQSMMPWQGDFNNMIDRFDVRANLDHIPEYVPDRHRVSDSNDDDERQANYERYRTLVENEAAALSEEHCLHQIYLDEHFGTTIIKGNEEEKKKNADKKAAIGYVYEGSTPVADKAPDNEDSEGDESLEEDIETADLDVTIDVDVLTPDQIREVNLCAAQYGMKDDDFVRLLRKDKEELEQLRAAKQLEEAKAQFSGRKSRRERRAINEKRQNPQRFSRPSYAARESPKYEPYKRPGSSSRSHSRSRSRSSEPRPVKFITSFGAESDDEGGVVQGPSLPSNAKSAAKKRASQREPSKCETPWLARNRSTQKESRGRPRRSSSRSSSTSRSRARGKHRSSSKSSFSSERSYSRSKSRSRSWSRSDNRRSSATRQGSNGRGSLTGSRRERRSHSGSSMSRSRSRSQSRSSRTKSLKRSESPAKKPVIKRYRRESLSTDSELSGMESEEEKQANNSSTSSPQLKNSSKNEPNRMSDSSKTGKIGSKPLLFQASSMNSKKTPQERLKRRMQAQLTRQFKADKKAEITKITKQEQERLDREEEIRTLALEMRRREREKRHREREEEEKERRERRKNRHPDGGSQSGSDDGSILSSSISRSVSPEKSQDSDHSQEKRDVDRVKVDRKLVDKQVDSGKEERRRRAPLLAQEPDERRRSGERRWEGRKDRSRWGEEEDDREKVRGPRGGRWDGPSGAHPSRFSGDRNWGSESGRWEGRRGDWNGEHRRSRPPYRSRGMRTLVPRSRSPLMSRPRVPSDPRLLEEPLNFD
ncbi:hypothetical protein BsWGS_10017 [Bradybaena similaris]